LNEIMMPGSGAHPWAVEEGDYTLELNGQPVGDIILDSSVGEDAARIRPDQAKAGKLWCLGYWNGLEANAPSMVRVGQDAGNTNCLYWALHQKLCPAPPPEAPTGGASTLNASFEGGHPFPAYYANRDVEDVAELVWQETDGGSPPSSADVIILGKEDTGEYHGQIVLAHSIVRAGSVKDGYIRSQMDWASNMPGLDFPALKGMYLSKSGTGGPVVLHSLEVYQTDESYRIIGAYNYK